MPGVENKDGLNFYHESSTRTMVKRVKSRFRLPPPAPASLRSQSIVRYCQYLRLSVGKYMYDIGDMCCLSYKAGSVLAVEFLT